MSWGTCNAGSNNIHFDFPPIMTDGRNYAKWQPGAVINQEIRKDNNCLLYTSPSPRDVEESRMPSSA